MLLACPKAARARLFDRSGWSPKQRAWLLIGKVFSLICLILIILTPLKVGTTAFFVGAALYALGLVGLAVAMLNFSDTPLDQPVTKGIYKVSRHP